MRIEPLTNVLLCALPIGSAFLAAVSFPSHDWSFLAWFGLAPLLWALRRGSAPLAACSSFLFGCTFGALALEWSSFFLSLHNRLIVIFLQSLYFVAFGMLYRLLDQRLRGWTIVSAPALWVVLEYIRANLFFLAWPWNLLGHSQYRFLPVIQAADVAGVYGISFLLVMVNQLVSELPDGFAALRPAGPQDDPPRLRVRPWLARLLVVCLVVGGVLLYGVRRLSEGGGRGHVRVALVQGNVLARDNMDPGAQWEHLKPYQRLSTQAARERPDLIVWPSASLPAPLGASRLVRETVVRLALSTGCHVLVGGAGYEKMKPREERSLGYSNSEFLVAPSGRLAGQYNKMRLVPFNEYVPLDGIVAWPAWITTLRESFLRGEQFTLFQAAGATFGSPICWENLFPDFFRQFVLRGANFMVSATNEGFFGPTAAPYQTLAMNVFRAVENRVAIARAAPTGVSAFIAPSGEILERIRGEEGRELFVEGFLVRDVPLMDRKTFYTMHGDCFAYAVMALAGILLLIGLSRRAGGDGAPRTGS